MNLRGKFAFLILTFALILSVFSFSGTVQAKIPESSGVGVSKPNTSAVIWKHPRDAKKIGHTFSTTTTISRKELIKISDYIDNREAGRNAQLGIATTILTAPLSPKISIGAGVGVALLSSYVNTNGKIVSSKLKNSTKKSFKVKITYIYRWAGSNDGYYYIDSVKVY
ncbi:hypothetical protein VSK91_15080 [Bacillus swezeyi]|uniref:hypothetical protein n=1 Tax=Bacillus swezeyi TaxID=1925020 RepID=UPI0039C75F9F